MTASSKSDIIGVVLAGGQSRRMGAAVKALVEFNGKALIERVIERLRPQVDQLVLNVNEVPERFERFGLPLVADFAAGPGEDYLGPLAGVAAGLRWARRHRPDCGRLVTVPCDMPLLPPDLAARLMQGAASAGAGAAYARYEGQGHYGCALWPVRAEVLLHDALAARRLKVIEALERLGAAAVDFPQERVSPFFDVNDAAGLDRLVTLVSAKS